jgi:hypothetical protein
VRVLKRLSEPACDVLSALGLPIAENASRHAETVAVRYVSASSWDIAGRLCAEAKGTSSGLSLP